MMVTALAALLLCAVEAEPSVASNPERRVRLHVDTEDASLRIVDVLDDRVVCYGTCDALLPAARRYRALQLSPPKTDEFTLSEIRLEAVLKPARQPRLILAGGIVTGVGVATLLAGAAAVLFGWYASGNGLNPQPWPGRVVTGGLVTAVVGLPIVLIGLPLLLYGLRSGYAVSERVLPPS